MLLDVCVERVAGDGGAGADGPDPVGLCRGDVDGAAGPGGAVVAYVCRHDAAAERGGDDLVRRVCHLLRLVVTCRAADADGDACGGE